jgi:hypothetical protein
MQKHSVLNLLIKKKIMNKNKSSNIEQNKVSKVEQINGVTNFKKKKYGKNY